MTIILAESDRLAEMAAQEIGLQRVAWICPEDEFRLRGLAMGTLCIVLIDCRPDPAIIRHAREKGFQIVDVDLQKLLMFHSGALAERSRLLRGNRA